MKILFFLISMLFLSNDLAYPQETDNFNPRDWKLVWKEDFSGKKVNEKKWNILTRETSKHGELQYYVPDEVYIQDGCLRIRSNKREFGDKHYTSGRLDTKDKVVITYGRVEIKGKLPVGKGLWPAYWLYPQNRDWLMECTMRDAIAKGQESMIPEFRPWYTEIDIMEVLGDQPSVFYATFHYDSFKGERKNSSGKYTAPFSFADDFHLFVLDWEPESIRWYIDGKLVHRVTANVPHTPHFLIINTAIGGSWPGEPNETTVFPQYHDIDYIKIYQRKNK